MRFASLDTFLMEDSFWQSRMGKPVANMEFLRALLQYGSSESYHFFCDDCHHLSKFQETMDDLVSGDRRNRVKASLKAHFLDHVERESFDVMHHGDFTYHMPYLIELRNRLNARFPVSGITHSLDGTWMQTRFIQLLLARPQSCDSIVCTSNCARELLTKAFENVRRAFGERFGARLPAPPDLVRIPLGLPDESFHLKEKSVCRDELGIPRNHFVMLSLARFSPRHKMDLAPVLEAIQWLSRNQGLPEFTLVLAGASRPADLSLVQSMIEHVGLQRKVRLESNISARGKALLFGASDVFLSMVDNYQETFGITIIEAMAQGIPVVASAFSGYKELVADGRTGFLIPTCASLTQAPWTDLAGVLDPSLLRFHQAQKVWFDVAELARSLTLLASDPRLRATMGARGRAASLRYHWGAIIPLYEDLWMNQREKADKSTSPGPGQVDALPLLTPEPENLFSHYTVRRLMREDRIRLSAYGKQRREEGVEPILYQDLDALLTKECNELLLGRAAEREWDVEELMSLLESSRGWQGHVVARHLDWLLKHGYLEISPRGRTGA